MVSGDIAEFLFTAARPGNFDQVHARACTHPEVRSQVALRQVAATAGDLTDLVDAARSDMNACTQRIAVAADAGEPQVQVVIPGLPGVV